MKKINVLVTSAGVMSAINVIKSLQLQRDYEIHILATDVDPYAPGLHLSDIQYISPPIKEEDEYIKFLFRIIRKHNVSILYPCYSKEISIISKHQKDFEKIGAHVLVPSVDVINHCNDKLRTSQLVESLGIPIPKIIDNPSLNDLPLFSRRLTSSSSKGAILVEYLYHLEHLMLSNEDRMYQEYIDGMEYTIDILCDRNSNVLIAAPRKRLATKSGQTVKGITVNNTLLNEYVTKICKAVELIGACNIQFMERENKFYFIEINPRYAAGGLMLTVNAGSNIPLLALKVMLGIPIENSELRHIPDIGITRYWEEIILNKINGADE